ncbi:VOC family protein [Paenibacillus tarimensis]
MEETAKKRVHKHFATKRNSDGYKPNAVPNLLKVIRGKGDELVQETASIYEAKSAALPLPEVVYDGSTIVVSRENHASVVEWFETYAGWKRTGTEFRSDSYINTELGPWGVWITCDDNIVLPEVTDTNVRFCFKTRDLHKMYSTLSDNDVKVSKIYRGPFEHDYFDFWIPFDGFRLTVEGDPSIENKELSNDWVRVGVSDIHKAKEWYVRHIGMSVISEQPEEGYVVMGMRYNFQSDDVRHPCWVLEQLPEHASADRKEERARPYTFVHSTAFVDYHRLLSEQGVPISDISGNPNGGLAKFHIFDIDGNRFNVRTFPM